MASKQVTEVAEKLCKTSEPKGSQLAKAILVAMKEVGPIPENRFNQRMGYKFARHQDIAEACRNAFLKAGLVMIPVGVEPTYTTVSTKGGDHRCVTLRVSYRLLHTSGEETYLQVVGCGADQSDKAEYKAMTGALKWALTQLLVLNRGREDSEVDAAGAVSQQGRSLLSGDHDGDATGLRRQPSLAGGLQAGAAHNLSNLERASPRA